MRQVKNNLASLTLRAKGRGSKDSCFCSILMKTNLKLRAELGALNW